MTGGLDRSVLHGCRDSYANLQAFNIQVSVSSKAGVSHSPICSISRLLSPVNSRTSFARTNAGFTLISMLWPVIFSQRATTSRNEWVWPVQTFIDLPTGHCCQQFSIGNATARTSPNSLHTSRLPSSITGFFSLKCETILGIRNTSSCPTPV